MDKSMASQAHKLEAPVGTQGKDVGLQPRLSWEV